MSIQTKIKTIGIYSITSALLIGAALASPAFASKGGNGPGNGTDDYANSLAIKKLADRHDGLSVEEKLYDMWVRAEGSVLDVNNPKNVGTWFGLKVANIGELSYWHNDSSSQRPSDLKNKYQKLFLVLKNIPALKLGEIEIVPAKTFGFFQASGNFDGNMDPRNTVYGQIDPTFFTHSLPLDGRNDYTGSSTYDEPIKPVESLNTGLSVHPFDLVYGRRTFSATVEYRQVDANSIVGVMKALPASVNQKPCPDANAVYRDVKVGTNDTRKVFDHWELAKDYGVPGVCEIHYLFKSKIDAVKIGD